MNEFDKAVAALITPEGQAFEDYINMESGENNPYDEGSADHKAYEAEMTWWLEEEK